MLNIYVDKNIGKIVLKTDDSSARYLLEKTEKETKFIPRLKRYGTITRTTKIYDNTRVKPDKDGVWTFYLGLGWAGYLASVFFKFMTKAEYDQLLLDAVYSDNVRTVPFPNLRDYQNADALHLLKYKIGLFSCYTSYGKTELIATLANYFYGIGKKVLIVTPGQKPRQEVEKRIKERFGIDVKDSGGRIMSIITSGLLKRNDIKDPDQLKKFENELASVDCLLVDEVEYTINDSGMFIYDRVIHADHFYGFSGTADKKKGEMISFVNGLDDSIIRNKDLIKYFGPSLVYRMPLDLKVDYIRVKTSTLNGVKFLPEDFAENTNVYNNVICRIFTDPDVCRLVVKIAKRYPRIYLPMYNLTSVINEWLGYFSSAKLRVLLICGEGFLYYDENGAKTKLKDLSEACEYVKNNRVDVIPSTSAGFRALDLPGLETTLLTIGKMAGVVLQSVGRTARGSHMNLITLEPFPKKKIPVYTNGMKERDEMILQYYKYCDIVESEIFDKNL